MSKTWTCKHCGCNETWWSKKTCANCGKHWKTPIGKGSAWDGGNPFTWEKENKEEVTQEKTQEQVKQEQAVQLKDMLSLFAQMFPEAAEATQKMKMMVDGQTPKPSADEVWKKLQSATDRRKDREKKLKHTTAQLEQKEQEVEKLKEDKDRYEEEVEELKEEIAKLTDEHVAARAKEEKDQHKQKMEVDQGTPEAHPGHMQAKPKAKVRRTQEQADTSTGRGLSDTDEELIPVPGTEYTTQVQEDSYITGPGTGDLSRPQDDEL